MAIGCDHPRPKLNLPGYTPPRFAWQPPALLPTGSLADLARALTEQFRGVYAVLQQLGQRRTVVPLIDQNIEAREGQVIVGVGDGQTIRLPEGGAGALGQVSVVLTALASPVTVVHPDGSTTTLGQEGAYDFLSGTPEVYQTSPGGSILGGGVPTDRMLGRDSAGTGAVEFIEAGGGLAFTGAGAVAVGAGTGITVNANDVAVTIPLTDGDKGDITVASSGTAWTIDNDAVTDAKLRNSAALSVIGRAANSTGDPADIAASAAGQVLKRLLSSATLAWENPVRIQDSFVSVGGGFFHTINIADGTNTVAVGTDSGGGTASIQFNVDDFPLSGLADAAARTVIANATNASAAPTAVQGSTARHVFRVNAAANGLEWGFPTAWQANGGALNDGFQINILNGNFTTAATGGTGGVREIQWNLDDAALLAAIDSTSIVVSGGTLQRAALTGAIAASQNSNATLFAGIRDNGAAENDRTNLNFLSTTSITAAIADDAANDELEITFQRAALTGDVTASANSNVTDIAADVVGNAELSDMLANSVKANPTAGVASPQDFVVSTNNVLGRLGSNIISMTGTQLTTIADVFTSALKGLAPASGGGTANFLRADGSWAAPPGGSSLPRFDDEFTDTRTGAFNLVTADGVTSTITRLTFTGAAPTLNSVEGGTDTGRFFICYYNGSGRMVVEHSLAGPSGNESRMFNPNNVDFSVGPREGFLLQANGTAGWRTYPLAQHPFLHAPATDGRGQQIQYNGTEWVKQAYSEYGTNDTSAISGGGDIRKSGAVLLINGANGVTVNTVASNLLATSASELRLTGGSFVQISGNTGVNITALSGVPHLYLEETATTPSTVAGRSAIWTRNTAPSSLMTTDDVGEDWPLGFNASAQATALTTTTNSTTVVTPASFTIPANTVIAGTCYRFYASLRCTRGATATATNLTHEFRVGGTSRVSVTTALNVTNGFVGCCEIEGYVTFLGTGASAPVTISGRTWGQIANNTTSPVQTVPSAALTANTTATIVLDIRQFFSAAVAATSHIVLAAHIQRVAN